MPQPSTEFDEELRKRRLEAGLSLTARALATSPGSRVSQDGPARGDISPTIRKGLHARTAER
ncbi:hypothetical protein EF902_44900 [Streptomyces sp. WAC05858]|nr:hypothetical protein EF902_44900 [Streptomyces sp. WAC05858]